MLDIQDVFYCGFRGKTHSNSIRDQGDKEYRHLFFSDYNLFYVLHRNGSLVHAKKVFFYSLYINMRHNVEVMFNNREF